MQILIINNQTPMMVRVLIEEFHQHIWGQTRPHCNKTFFTLNAAENGSFTTHKNRKC